MKLIYLILGTLFLLIGLVGIILPILPTTPFLLLTSYFYARGSTRFNTWFINTKIYNKYLKDFLINKTMKKKEKWQLMLFVDVIVLISILVTQNVIVTIVLIVIDIIKYLYFQFNVKTI